MIITKATFDSEVQRRIAAEAESLRANEEVIRLHGIIERERERHDAALKEKDERHAAETKDLLDRFQPKIEKNVSDVGPPRRLRASELLRRAAIGGQGLRERNAEVRDAIAWEHMEAAAKEAEDRKTTLTPAEQMEVDLSLTN